MNRPVRQLGATYYRTVEFEPSPEMIKEFSDELVNKVINRGYLPIKYYNEPLVKVFTTAEMFYSGIPLHIRVNCIYVGKKKVVGMKPLKVKLGTMRLKAL